MDRMACVDLHSLPLQLLLWRHRDWRAHPVAVVDRDKPQGIILWVNELARGSRILPGMRYSAALSLDSELRASVVSDDEIEAGIALLTERLWCFSPRVEPSSTNAGVFWLDASGILPLYRSYREWAERIRDELAAERFEAAIVVGFSRFPSYAVARATSSDNGVIVFDSPGAEIAQSRAVPIDRLDFQPRLRDTLNALGIERVGQFIDLPASGIHRRFGVAASELHRRARGDAAPVFDPVPPSEPLECRLIFDHPEADLGRVMETITTHLSPLMRVLHRRHEALAAVSLRLELDDGSEVDETLEPAEPTLDESQVVPLIRLRLEGISLSAGIGELELSIRGVAATSHQLDLFDVPPRDLSAARRALARIRARFGDKAVMRARLQDGHLPEARFTWERIEKLDVPHPTETIDERPLIRRYFPFPVELPLRSRHEPDGWVINLADGPVEEVIGPHVVSGGWWIREISRDYYYVRTRSGRWLWIYNDRRRRRWFLQGEVE